MQPPHKPTVTPSSATIPTRVDGTLVKLRSLSLDLHARLSELRDTTAMLRDGVGPGRNSDWELFLERYDTLSKLTRRLTEELERAQTEGVQHLIAEPRQMSVPGQTPIPELLRTRLEPAIERDFSSLASTAPSIPQVDIAKGIIRFNRFLENALAEYQDTRDMMVEDRPVENAHNLQAQSADAVLAAISSGAGLK